MAIVTLSASLSSQIADDYFTEKELEGNRPEIIPEETDDVSPITSPANTERRTLSDLVTGKGDMDPSEEPLSSPPPSESTLPDHQIPVSSVFVFGSTGSLHSEYYRYCDHNGQHTFRFMFLSQRREFCWRILKRLNKLSALQRSLPIATPV